MSWNADSNWQGKGWQILLVDLQEELGNKGTCLSDITASEHCPGTSTNHEILLEKSCLKCIVWPSIGGTKLSYSGTEIPLLTVLGLAEFYHDHLLFLCLATARTVIATLISNSINKAFVVIYWVHNVCGNPPKLGPRLGVPTVHQASETPSMPQEA